VCLCDKDVDEIRNDTSRCEEFVQLYTALKAFIKDSINLPDSSEVFDIFGKVGNIHFVSCTAFWPWPSVMLTDSSYTGGLQHKSTKLLVFFTH